MNDCDRLRIEVSLTDPCEEGRQLCNVIIEGPGGGAIGDSESWTVVELMSSSVNDMLQLLSGQRPEPTLFGAASEVFDSLRVLRESSPVIESMFFALPRSVECFDGEVAYLIRGQCGAGRFIWRDYNSRQIRERKIGFDEYLMDWRAACAMMR
jgi:hypothetical protein